MRVPIVGVMGSGFAEHADIAAPLGRRIALEGFHLLTGGGRGVMEAVTRAFVSIPKGNRTGERSGIAIGIVPGERRVDLSGNIEYREKRGYPNPWVEIVIRTHLPGGGAEGKDALSRNHINVLTSDFVVILPGGNGTRSEAELCAEYKKTSQFHLLEKADEEALNALIEKIRNAL